MRFVFGVEYAVMFRVDFCRVIGFGFRGVFRQKFFVIFGIESRSNFVLLEINFPFY